LYSGSYNDLIIQNKAYFGGTGSYPGFTSSLLDYNGFIRLVQFFDNSMFKMLEDNVPARTSLSTGVTFNSPVLERNKWSYAQPNAVNELEKDVPKEEQTKYAQTDPLSFIERYCSKLSVPPKYTKLAQFIAIQIQKRNLIPENTPHSIAGGIIYFVSQVCNLNISKSAINNVSKISEVTINKCYKKLESYKTILIPQTIIAKYN
jgi:hypothetical protein